MPESTRNVRPQDEPVVSGRGKALSGERAARYSYWAMIPFNKPVSLGTELSFIAESIIKNAHVSGGGPFTRLCEAKLQAIQEASALLTSSCTHALEMAALVLGVGPGDEVIVPSFTFVSTANAFALRGAQIVFADVDGSGNISLESVSRLLSPRTRAVVPVHYGGASCDMFELIRLVDGIPIVEDAAQAIGSTFQGKKLGTFGLCSAMSFHETKNVGCGEGGAFFSSDQSVLGRAYVLRDKGTNRKRFLDGLVDKYTWVDLGSSYVLSDLNAAYLYAQLSGFDQILDRRRAVARRYGAELASVLEHHGVRLWQKNEGCSDSAHLCALIMRSAEDRSRFIAHMKERGVNAPFHYVALHTTPFGRRYGANSLPTSENLSDCLVRLPLYYNIKDEEQEVVIDAVRAYFEG